MRRTALCRACLAALLCLAGTDALAKSRSGRRERAAPATSSAAPSAVPSAVPSTPSAGAASGTAAEPKPGPAAASPAQPPEPEPEPAPLELPEPPPAPLLIAPTPTPSRPGEDVVEVIEVLDERSPPPARRVEATAPVSPDQFQLTGFTRARLSVGLVSTGAEESDPYAVPHDRLITQGQLFLRARYARSKWFEAVLSGVLSAGLFEQDARPPDSFTLFNGELRSAFEPTLREAYVGFFVRRFDLRIGQQRIAWGRGELFAPNDVVNPLDLRDQFLTETELLRLPTLALRGDLALGPVVLSAVIAPYFQPHRFDSYGGNWALLQPGAPAIYRALAQAAKASLAIDPTLYPALQPLLQQTALPPADLTGTAVGLRLQLALHRLDLDFFYHYGYDYNPALTIDPTLTATLEQIDPATADPSTLSTALLSGVSAGSVSATYVRRHHAGASAVTTAGPLVLRGDVAFDSQAVFTGKDLQSVLAPSLQAVLGAEYQPGELGKLILLELHYQYIHDLPAADALLFQRTHNVSLGGLLRWSVLRDRLRFELRGAVGLVPLGYSLRPQIAFAQRGFEVRLGVFIPGGEDGSPGRYFDRNLSIYSAFRFSF